MRPHSQLFFQFTLYYLACCNIIDGFITYWGVQNSVIEEANPMMKALVHYHPYAFLIFKLALSIVLIFIGIMKFEFDSRFVSASLIVASILYTFIVVYHAYWLFLL
ncbi:DUF5658 family protein [Alkalihalobacillus sp. R86527]|uniref:DUF5658 family protein n=1 Tax=Alkalihalobacillus sp. R86527 TaxID=3093863 RepID=UPI00366D8BCF